MTTAESPTPAPTPPASANPLGLVSIAAMIVGGFIFGGLVMTLLTRQTIQEVSELRRTVSTLQQDLERLRENTKTLAVVSDRSVLVNFTDTGFVPVRTNGGTLLVALANVTGLQNTVIVQLRIGNPQSVTYEGFSMTFEWDKQKSQQAFHNVLEPGQWTTVQATLSPADPVATKSVRITAASVDQIRVR